MIFLLFHRKSFAKYVGSSSLPYYGPKDNRFGSKNRQLHSIKRQLCDTNLALGSAPRLTEHLASNGLKRTVQSNNFQSHILLHFKRQTSILYHFYMFSK